MRKKVGNYLLDLSKITFAGGILAGILSSKNITDLQVVFISAFIFVLCVVIGFILIKKK